METTIMEMDAPQLVWLKLDGCALEVLLYAQVPVITTLLLVTSNAILVPIMLA